MRLIIQVVLWVIIGALGYFLFSAIYGEVKFNDLKVVRYQKAVDKLKDIRDAQLAHKQVTGVFAKNFEDLIRFVDTAEYTLTARRDTTVLDVEQTKAYGVDTMKEETIIDTIGKKSVRDSLFGTTGRYKDMMTVQYKDHQAKIIMEAGRIVKNDIPIAVFEAKVPKNELLWDQPKDYLNKEKQVLSTEGINGSYVTVGSMTDVNTNGNWPKSYDAKRD